MNAGVLRLGSVRKMAQGVEGQRCEVIEIPKEERGCGGNAMSLRRRVTGRLVLVGTWNLVG